MPVTPDNWEAEIQRIMVQGQLGEKVSETHSINKPCVMVFAYDLSYTGGVGVGGSQSEASQG
jgi:hypothetical protein